MTVMGTKVLKYELGYPMNDRVDEVSNRLTQHLIECGRASSELKAQVQELKAGFEVLRKVISHAGIGLVGGLFSLVGVLIWALLHNHGIV